MLAVCATCRGRDLLLLDISGVRRSDGSDFARIDILLARRNLSVRTSLRFEQERCLFHRRLLLPCARIL
jgi:hypothetical protein